MKSKRKVFFLSFSLLGMIIILLFYISRNPLITDDLSPVASCSVLTQKSDILFVIPNYDNHSLDLYPQWCKEMKTLNKTFGMHGITHKYHEFLEPINEEEMAKGIKSFEQCFGYKPELFRPPYNKISLQNKALLESFNFTLYQEPYFVHPYCHCNPKRWMKILNLLVGC